MALELETPAGVVIIPTAGPPGVSIAGPQGDQGEVGPQGETGSVGPMGPAGAGSLISRTATATVPAWSAIVADGAGNCRPADPSNPAQRQQVIAVTATGGAVGDVVQGQAVGDLVGANAGFVPGTTLFVGAGGVLTATPPTSGWRQAVAAVVADGHIVVNLGEATIIAADVALINAGGFSTPASAPEMAALTTNISHVTPGDLAAPFSVIGLTRAQIATTPIPYAIKAFRASGYAAAGDGGVDAPYIRSPTGGSGPAAIKDALGQWWCLDLSMGYTYAEWWGADNTGVRPSAAAIEAAAAALMATATRGVRTLLFKAGRFLFERRVNVTIPPVGSNIDALFNGFYVQGAGKWATKFVPTEDNAQGLWKINFVQAQSITEMRNFTMSSLLQSDLSANIGKNNGVAIWVTKTDGTPDNPLASGFGQTQVLFENINVHGDDYDAGVAVPRQGLWAKVFQVDYAWVPTWNNVLIATPVILGNNLLAAETTTPALNTASRLAGTAQTAWECNGCYDPQILQNCKSSGFFETGFYYHATPSRPDLGQRQEGGSMIMPEIGNCLDCVVIDTSWNFTVTGTVAVGSTTITGVTSPRGIFPGWQIRGFGLARGTRVLAYDTTARTITLSRPVQTASSGPWEVVVETDILPDDFRIIQPQFAPLRHGVVFRQFQSATIIGGLIFLYPNQYDPGEPLPAAVLCDTSSEIHTIGVEMVGGYADYIDANAGPDLRAACGIRVEGASTGIVCETNVHNQSGVALYAYTIPTAGDPVKQGYQRSIRQINPQYSGRNNRAVTNLIKIFDPLGCVIETAIDQDPQTDHFDSVSRLLGSDYPRQRLRRLNADFAAQGANKTIGSVDINGLTSVGNEKTMAAMVAGVFSNSEGSERSYLNVYVKVAGVDTVIGTFNGVTGRFEATRATISDLDLSGAVTATSDSDAASKGVGIGKCYILSSSNAVTIRRT